MDTVIKCIHCGREFKPSDAIAHQIAEETERIKKTVEQDARKKLQAEFEEKEKTQKLELEKREKEQKELIEFEQKKAQKIIEDYEKKKLEDEEKIKEETEKNLSEKHRLEKLEFEKKINDMQKALEEAQRKGKQGSQQLQGEVLELDLEEQLKKQFPTDEFLPVPKGVEGGDIWQKVADKQGKEFGSILWETKRTKAWSPSWLPKLREDARRVGASECIIVSEVLPNEVKSYHRIDNVWVSNYEFAIQTARMIRFLIISVASAKAGMNHNDEELNKIRQYITSDAFRHKFESHQESVNALREDLRSEMRTTEARWKKRSAQIDRLDRNSSQMYGELQGIIPELEDIQQSALPAEIESEIE